VPDSALSAILEEAKSATGLDDFGDEWFLGPLGAWVSDLAQPNLTELGRRFLGTLAVRDLARRLQVLDFLSQHPEVADVPIPPIVYIIGLPRSGTTLLHNVLARNRQARVFRRWELMQPLPPPETATYDSDPRIAAVQASIDKRRGSLLERMHWVNADEPEECPWGFIDSVSMLGQSVSFCMPRWGRFLMEEDLTPALEHYRQVVQLLLWKHPVPPGGFLVLKGPQVAVHIAAFAGVFPEAYFVLTDRDPFRCIVSAALMVHALIEPFCVENPLTDDGRSGRSVLSWVRPSLSALANFADAVPDRTTRVAYPALVDDPVGTAQRVFATIGVPGDDHLVARIEQFLDRQRAGGRAAPPPELPDSGYVQDDVWCDPVVRDYGERFGIEPERTRLTGAERR
jgi:hypothetical protein